MKIQVLGSAAGGGFPQWNCNCSNCAGLRGKTIKARARTQSSIAVSSDERNWILFNASPDIRAQLEAFPPLQPHSGLRDTGIAAIVLADSQLDHTTGLLLLREGCPHSVYATDMVLEDLTSGFPVFPILESWNGGLKWQQLKLDGSAFRVPKVDHIEVTAVPISGKAPPYSPHRHDPHMGDNVGIYLRDSRSNQSVFYAPGLASIEENVSEYMHKSSCVMVDGTFWTDDEMQLAGVGTKRASDMGHLPQSGAGGMIEQLAGLPSDTRKILIHINNTNPILIEDSPQRRLLDEANIEVAFDGMCLDFSQVYNDG